MPLPTHIFNPPFNVVRCSHAVLTARDLEASRAFYEGAIGLHVEDAGKDAIYFRGMEERNHHSLVLKRGPEPVCERLGFKVGSEEDLDRACTFFKERQLPAEFVEVPFQGRTLHAADAQGNPLELYFKMEQARAHPAALRPLQGLPAPAHRPLQPVRARRAGDGGLLRRARLPHDRVHRERGGRRPRSPPPGCTARAPCTTSPSPAARGPACTTSPTGCRACINVVHLCDVMATTGYLANMERGPGRHGLANAFFLYVRDPDGHRIELYASDYLTVDPDFEPIRWSLRDPRRQTLWGTPAPKSWFEEGTAVPRHAGAAAGAQLQPDRGELGRVLGARCRPLARVLFALHSQLHAPFAPRVSHRANE